MHWFKSGNNTLRFMSNVQAVGFRRSLLAIVSGSLLLSMGGVDPSAAVTRRLPASFSLIVNRVTGAPTLDLPPLDQRPLLYAELDLDGVQFTTEAVVTPQIGASIYPDWSLAVDKEAIWIERGHPIEATLRIFDADDDEDDKVLMSSFLFDPIACEVTVGSTALEGDRVGSACTVVISELRGVNGKARITLAANW